MDVDRAGSGGTTTVSAVADPEPNEERGRVREREMGSTGGEEARGGGP